MAGFEENYEEDFDEDFDEGAFSSPAWLLKGITGSLPGYLELENERLVFTIERQVVFDVPLTEVNDVIFPWYYFSGGVKFKIGDDKYRLSFIKPNNIPGYPDVGGGRQAGKIWKSLLEKQTG